MDDSDDSEDGTSSSMTEDFDVFLNHRGPDVKATFVAHLEEALGRAGFRPFLDARSLMKGNPALQSIDQALAMAKVHVAVVSRRYAESKYCLNELVAMMSSGKPVVPVLYGVEPLHLRCVEHGPFAQAFEIHKSKGRTKQKLQQWRDALHALASLTAFRLADYKSNEAKLKRKVVNEVARFIPSNNLLEVEDYRVGLEGQTKSCIEVLETMGVGIGMLGLMGVGGVGKTTLAKEIYNHFVAQKKFRCMSFLEIHYNSSSSNAMHTRPIWVRDLRKQLLWDLLRVHDTTSNYNSSFQKVSTLGPVLIVIDNVHEQGQFEALIPLTSILHLGSRIIVTSRDQSILSHIAHRMDHQNLFDVPTLEPDDSNMLFNLHAFHAIKATEDYVDLAKDVVRACGGLPLALKIIGSSLFGRRLASDKKTIWLEAIDALRQNTNVISVLRWSYDNLPKPEKFMFLDITCLFYNRSAKEAFAYWENCKNCMSCGGVYTPHTSLQNLIDKNLVIKDVHFESLRVHDLLRDLGLKIGMKVKRHFVDDGIREVPFIETQGSTKTIGLDLTRSQKRKFESKDFANMPNLHFLHLPDGSNIDGDFKGISKKLRVLQWKNMPLEHVPAELNLFHLTSLDFSKSSNLISLWMESHNTFQGCPNLQKLNLSECKSIRNLPISIGQSSRLQYLYLHGCKNLEKLPKSIGQLNALESLDLSHCTSLKALPKTIGTLSNLQRLDIGHCTSLVKLPTSIGLLSSLQWLQIEANVECQAVSGGTIGETWTWLRTLQLLHCGGLGSVLEYGALKSLWFFILSESALTQLPESFGLLTYLENLQFDSCERLQSLPNSIGDFKMLKTLGLLNCPNLKRLPKNLGALANLRDLNIEFCPIKRLPKSIGLLSQLQELILRGCKNLQKLPSSIRHLKNLQWFGVWDCGSIEAMGALTTLQGLPLWGSTSITKLPPSLGTVSNLLLCEGKALSDYTRGSLFVGSCQVLEGDESGCFRAYQDESSGLTKLLRESHQR